MLKEWSAKSNGNILTCFPENTNCSLLQCDAQNDNFHATYKPHHDYRKIAISGTTVHQKLSFNLFRDLSCSHTKVGTQNFIFFLIVSLCKTACQVYASPTFVTNQWFQRMEQRERLRVILPCLFGKRFHLPNSLTCVKARLIRGAVAFTHSVWKHIWIGIFFLVLHQSANNALALLIKSFS